MEPRCTINICSTSRRILSAPLWGVKTRQPSMFSRKPATNSSAKYKSDTQHTLTNRGMIIIAIAQPETDAFKVERKALGKTIKLTKTAAGTVPRAHRVRIRYSGFQTYWKHSLHELQLLNPNKQAVLTKWAALYPGESNNSISITDSHSLACVIL